MQNLLFSNGVGGGGEALDCVTGWGCVTFCLGILVDKTVIAIETPIATTMTVKKIGSSAIKLIETGSFGWMVG